jgi:hypothetical protein
VPKLTLISCSRTTTVWAGARSALAAAADFSAPTGSKSRLGFTDDCALELAASRRKANGETAAMRRSRKVVLFIKHPGTAWRFVPAGISTGASGPKPTARSVAHHGCAGLSPA